MIAEHVKLLDKFKSCMLRFPEEEMDWALYEYLDNLCNLAQDKMLVRFHLAVELDKEIAMWYDKIMAEYDFSTTTETLTFDTATKKGSQ